MMQAFCDLTGRRAVVTGASSGIGRAIALELARGGADVAVHFCRSADAAGRVAAQITALGRRSLCLQADFSYLSAVQALAETAWRDFGPAHIWVNNAGVDLLTGAAAKLEYAEKLQRLLDVDVRATALLSRDVGRRMQAAGGGVIVNIGWDQADRGM
jgi:3-oxoacyl-[acyl-carrier protein] reductase